MSALALAPAVHRLDRGGGPGRALTRRDPVHRGEELHPEGGLEALDEIRDAIEAGARLRMIAQERGSVRGRAGDELELLLRGVAAVRVA